MVYGRRRDWFQIRLKFSKFENRRYLEFTLHVFNWIQPNFQIQRLKSIILGVLLHYSSVFLLLPDSLAMRKSMRTC